MPNAVTEKTILNILSAAMFQKELCLSDDIDWKAVYRECGAQSVVPLAFSVVPAERLPSEIYEKWGLRSNIAIAANSKICYAHTMLHELMKQSGIPYVILKGCVSADYYNDPLLRTMGDVDFLVPKECFQKAAQAMVKNGFVDRNINHEYEKAYSKNDVVFELHNMINGVPGGKTGAAVSKYFDDIFEESELKTLDIAEYNSPSAFHHGLIMLLHVARHMITGGIGLRHFCDWAVFADKVGDDFPAMFEEKLKAVGLWRFAQIMTQFCTAYLGCPEQVWAGQPEEALLNDLKNDVFEGGNFGHKDSSRSDEAKFITSRKKGGVNDDSDTKQAVLSANEIVRKHWKFADKFPVVYPVGWAFFGGRYAVRALLGKRKKIDLGELAEGAEKRKEIYRGLELFEK